MVEHKGQDYLAACQGRTMNKRLKVWENTFYPENCKSEGEEMRLKKYQAVEWKLKNASAVV